jgi:hypothetical protein
VSITLHSETTGVSGGPAVQSFTLGAPSGTVEGNLEVLVACIEDSISTSNFLALSGWTPLYNRRTAASTFHRHGAWWRIAPSSPGSVTVEWDGNTRRWIAGRFRLSGHDPTTPIPTLGTILDTTRATDPSPTWDVAGITTPRDNCLVFLPTFISFGQFTNTPRFPAPSGWSLTGVNDNSNFNTGQPAGAVFTRAFASAGATGDATITPGALSGGSSTQRGVTGVMFAVQPAAAPPPAVGRSRIMWI